MKKVFLTIALLVSCSMTSILHSQSYEAVNKVREQLKPYMDTLDFEYEGPLQLHEKIIIRVISHIQKKSAEAEYNVRYMSYALVKSYNKRISSLAENYVKKNAKVSIVKVKAKMRGFRDYEYNEYELINGLNSINYRTSTSEKLIGEKYIEVLLSHCNVQKPHGYLSFPMIKKRVLDNIENNDFATLLSEAERNGIKKTATENGFYNKKIAKQLAEIILINKIENLYKSNKELAYRVVYIADANTALHKLTYESEQEEMLEIMINKY